MVLNFGCIKNKNMLFIPKNSKYKKFQKGSLIRNVDNLRNLKICRNKSLKLICVEFGNLTTKQLVAIRFLVKKLIKKKGFVRFRIFPQWGISKKPLEIRMGKGKGNLSHWITKLRYGTTICEIFYKKRYKSLLTRGLKKIRIKISLKTIVKN